MNKLHFSLIVIFLLLPITGAADDQQPGAELGTSQAPLARQGDVVLTQAEIDAAFSKIPEEFRLTFIRSGDKVETLVRNLLMSKTLAEEARKAGYDKDTLVAISLDLAAESELATEWLADVVAKAPPVDYELIARENYLLSPEAWMGREYIDVSHILIGIKDRSPEEALVLADDLYEQLVADPSLYDSMVAEYSEDPSKVANGGRYQQVYRDDMVKQFEEAAFALKEPGQISAPVKTVYGYHIIRLNEYFPPALQTFEDIKEQAIEQARKEYLDEYRNNYLRKVLSNPIVLPDGAAEEMAKRYFGENLELAPEMED